MPIVTPQTMKILAPDLANIDQTAEPTVEGQGATDYLGNSIADGSQAINAMDGYPARPVTVDTSGERTTWRLDTVLTKRRTYGAFVIDGHNLPVAYPLALRDMINILAHTSDAVGSATEVAYSKIISGLLGKGRPSLHFDKIDDILTVSDDPDLDFGYGDFSIEWIVYLDSLPVNKIGPTQHGGATGRLSFYISSGGAVVLYDDDGVDPYSTSSSSGEVVVRQFYHLTATVDRDGNTVIYKNSSAIKTASTNIPTDEDIDYGADLNIREVSGAAERLGGNVLLLRYWNRCLSAAEVLSRYNGWTHTPIPVADRSGAVIELMPNQVDRDFSGASAWANVDIDAYDETDDLTITATAIGQRCELPVTSIPMTATYHYRLYFDVANLVSTWEIRDKSGAQTFGTVTANGTNQFIEITVDAGITGGLRVISVANDSSADFDNWSLVRTGCVLELNHDGIDKEAAKLEDASGNDLHGAISGCEYIDCPDDDDLGFYLVEFTDVVDNLYWFLQLVQDDSASNARADSLVGLAAPCKVYEFNIKAEGGYGADFGYPGVRTRTTASARKLAEQYYGRLDRFDVNLAPMTVAEFGDFQEFQDITGGARFPFYVTFNDDDDEPIYRRLRMVGMPRVRVETGSIKPFNVSLTIEEDEDEV